MKRKFFTIILLAAIISLACTTRVSEWVLLNARPNQYTLVYFHNGSVSESVKNQNQKLAEGISTANILFKNVSRQEIAEPYYGLYYEGRFFTKFETVDDLRGLTTSPSTYAVQPGANASARQAQVHRSRCSGCPVCPSPVIW